MTDLKPGSNTCNLTKWKAWGLRPIVLFVAAYTMVGVLHELTHALVAYAFRIPFTLFHFAVNVDRAHGTLNQRAIIGVAGPLFALGIGLLSWGAYTVARNSRLGLPLLYLVMFGVSTFFGNLISTAFVGDFSRLAMTLQLPMAVRYSASVLGVLLLCGLSFLIGMELRRWTPVGVSAAKAMIGMIALPAIIGGSGSSCKTDGQRNHFLRHRTLALVWFVLIDSVLRRKAE